MENFEFVSPTHFVFGRGAEEQVGEKLAAAGAKRVLVHFGGGSAVASGLIDRVGASLDAAGIEHLELGGVRPNPEITLVREGVRLCKEANVDWILAVGGGSVIDSAKAIANGACVEGDVWELFETKALDHDVLPIAVVLTIPAAGSEASKNTVISNDELGRKTGYANNAQRPKFAFMNPELTYSLPAFQTAAPGADIMMHTMERYFTREKGTQLIDAMSEGLMRTVRAAVPAALADPTSYEARANLMWAGSLSHCGLTGTGLVGDFASHAIGQELGAMFDMAHGVSLTAIWSTWAKYVLDVRPERFAQFGVNVFGVVNDFDDVRATALRGIEAWDQWCHSIGMPTSLSEAGVNPTDEQIHEMAVSAVEARGGDHAGAFMELHVEDIEQILKNAR